MAYAAGHYGTPPAPIDPDVLDRIMSSPRAPALAASPPEQPSLAEIRRRYGDPADDDELILRAVLPAEAIDAMRAAGPVREDYPLVTPEAAEILRLLSLSSTRALRYRRAGLDVSLDR